MNNTILETTIAFVLKVALVAALFLVGYNHVAPAVSDRLSEIMIKAVNPERRPTL